jgi:hypothetical protein
MIPTHLVSFWQYFDVVTIAMVSVVVAWLMLTHRKKGNLCARSYIARR